MHQVFDEIGHHLKQMGYKGAKRTYRKRLDTVEILVELEPCESGSGFRMLVGTHLNPDLAPEEKKRRRVHDCDNCRPILEPGGQELWPFHADREERIAMVGTILRGLSRIEGELG